ncbi:MAG TPA: hypothetical protein PLS69_10540 [Terricaulis sp.]|nr:hypothetical protein [Terricaulis sp.]HRP12216.1 hypothetical protein [Terricaulis sp.]
MLKELGVYGVLVAILPGSLIWLAVLVLLVPRFLRWRADLAASNASAAKSNADAAQDRLRQAEADIKRRTLLSYFAED